MNGRALSKSSQAGKNHQFKYCTDLTWQLGYPDFLLPPPPPLKKKKVQYSKLTLRLTPTPPLPFCFWRRKWDLLWLQRPLTLQRREDIGKFHFMWCR